MQILELECGPLGTMCYLIVDEQKNAVLIDAAPDSFSQVSQVCNDNNIKISAVLLTHSHWDHTTDASLFQSEMKAEIYINQDDEYRILNPKDNALMQLPFDIPLCKADKYLEDGQLLKFGDIELKVITTPGHTEGGVCFILESEKMIFCGDTIFADSVGRTDLPGGDYAKLKSSVMKKLYLLPDDYKLFPGHGESTMLGYEKRNNSYIRMPVM